VTRQPAISVVVANHNYRDYVADAIDSALAQTTAPLEVIVVDDGSTDGSAELIRQRFGNDTRVRLIATANQGQLAALCTGVAACGGEAIAFLDADDCWQPDHLATLADVLAQRPDVDFVYGNLERFGREQGRWHADAADRDLGVRPLQEYHLQPWHGSPTSALLLRARLCRSVLEMPGGLAGEWRTRADDCLVLGAGILGAHKYFVARPTVRYRVHGGNRWYGAGDRAGTTHAYLARVRRVVDFYGRKGGLSVLPPMSVIVEFKALPAPTFGDLAFYLRMLRRVPWPLFTHVRQSPAPGRVGAGRRPSRTIARPGRPRRSSVAANHRAPGHPPCRRP
jgi:glycosyltransferase involved in cell wall biosynthesis